MLLRQTVRHQRLARRRSLPGLPAILGTAAVKAGAALPVVSPNAERNAVRRDTGGRRRLGQAILNNSDALGYGAGDAKCQPSIVGSNRHNTVSTRSVHPHYVYRAAGVHHHLGIETESGQHGTRPGGPFPAPEQSITGTREA